MSLMSDALRKIELLAVANLPDILWTGDAIFTTATTQSLLGIEADAIIFGVQTNGSGVIPSVPTSPAGIVTIGSAMADSVGIIAWWFRQPAFGPADFSGALNTSATALSAYLNLNLQAPVGAFSVSTGPSAASIVHPALTLQGVGSQVLRLGYARNNLAVPGLLAGYTTRASRDTTTVGRLMDSNGILTSAPGGSVANAGSAVSSGHGIVAIELMKRVV